MKYTSIETYREDDTNIYYDRGKGGHVSYEGVADKNYFIFRNPDRDEATSNSILINPDPNELLNQEIYFNNFTPITLKKGDKFKMKFVTNAAVTNKSRLIVYLMDMI